MTTWQRKVLMALVRYVMIKLEGEDFQSIEFSDEDKQILLEAIIRDGSNIETKNQND